MATTNYYNVNGIGIGEQVGSSSRVDYLTDALGSVTATVNQIGNVVNSYRYKPYGDVLARSGSGVDSDFAWVGSQGYRTTGSSYSSHYVRRRHYSQQTATWLNSDPIGYADGLNLFQYARQQPTTNYDRSGLSCCCCNPVKINVSSVFKVKTDPRAPGYVVIYNHMTIKLSYAYSSVATPSLAGDCSLQYYEKMNVQATWPGAPDPGNWQDDFPYEENKPDFAGWGSRAKPCPGSASATIYDDPDIAGAQGPLGKGVPDRTLCFRIELSSGGSGCKKNAVIWEGYQLLSWKHFTGVVIQGSIPYCKYP